MKPNQKLVQGDTQVALFPMVHLRITQGRYNKFSHKGYNATDLAGKDGSAEKWYAPFDIKVEWLDASTKTGVVISNTKRVLMANGKIVKPHTISIMLWHDNNISGLRIGQTYKQGDYFYMEGTAGRATGNHIHMELSYWKYDGSYPLFKLRNGYWTLKGKELNIEDLFFINDTKILDAKGYKFKTYKAPKPNKTKPKGKEYVVLDKSVDRWGMYRLGVQPVSRNIFNHLRPKKFGGLEYEILGRPYPNTVTIQTRQFGKVNIWIGPTTPHKIITK